jgi:hypothetical protein
VIVERVNPGFRWRHFITTAVPIDDDDKVLHAILEQAAETSAPIVLNFWGNHSRTRDAALKRHSPSKT